MTRFNRHKTTWKERESARKREGETRKERPVSKGEGTRVPRFCDGDDDDDEERRRGDEKTMEENARNDQRDGTIGRDQHQYHHRLLLPPGSGAPVRRDDNSGTEKSRSATKSSMASQQYHHPAQPDSNTFKKHYQDLVMLYKTLMERAKGPKTLKKTFLARNLTYIKPRKEKKRKKKTIIAQKSRSSNDSDKDKKKMDGDEEEKDEMKPRDDLDVIFRYFYKGVADLRVSEKTERSYRSRCPFCFIKPRNFVGLCQHLNASHDQFYFTFLPVNTIQQRIVTDPNGLCLSKSEDKVLTMNTIEVRIKKTSFVMCENGQDKLNMLDATLLKDPANKSFEYFSGGKYPKVGTNTVILPAIGNLAPSNTSSQDVQSKAQGWESELAVLKTKLNVEIRNKQLQKQNELQLKSIEENISQVAKNAALKEQKRATEGNSFGQFFMPQYYDKFSLERAAAVLNRENTEKYGMDFFFNLQKKFGNDIDLTKVVHAAKERVQAENRATVEKFGQFHVGLPEQIEQQQRLLQQLNNSDNMKNTQLKQKKTGKKRNRENDGDEEMPIGYAASEQLIIQRIQKETKEKYLEKEAKKRKKEEAKTGKRRRQKAEQEAANNTSQQKKNFRQSAQHQEVVATKKTAIQETGSKRSFAIGGRYYHSRTCLPMSKKIFKRKDKFTIPDSDDDDKEQEEMWDEEDALYIDEYVDVAQVEKDFFRMWNKHVRKYCVMANRQMPDCTSSFMYVHKETLVKDRQMRKLFHLHLMNMYEFGVLSGKVIQALVAKMNDFRCEWDERKTPTPMHSLPNVNKEKKKEEKAPVAAATAAAAAATVAPHPPPVEKLEIK